MADKFEEVLKGQVSIGTISDLTGSTVNKTLHMIFIVDISGSMSGSRIKNVNEAFRSMVPILQDLQRTVQGAFQLCISILTFGSEAEWHLEPTPILEYSHKDLKADGGGTSYGKAFEMLEKKLHREAFMSAAKIAEPYVMFMTDGHPTDSGYEEMLEELRHNLYYGHAQRYAVLIGKDAINDAKARTAVGEFVSDVEEGIVTAEEAEAIVRVVSAKTIHTVRQMTVLTAAGDKEKSKNGNNTSTGIDPGYKNPFDEDWDFNPKDIYDGEFTF